MDEIRNFLLLQKTIPFSNLMKNEVFKKLFKKITSDLNLTNEFKPTEKVNEEIFTSWYETRELLPGLFDEIKQYFPKNEQN